MNDQDQIDRLLRELGNMLGGAIGPTQAELDAKRANLARRAAGGCEDAIGKPFQVRTGKKSVQAGTIVECTVHDVVRCGARSIKARFKVVMECGVNKVRREYIVDRIPR